MTEVALQVSHISKMYKLYDKPIDRLKEALGFTKQKKYSEHYALNDVNFVVNKGDCVGIIGTNGSGKSTVLKIITGVLSPTAGDVAVNGRISALLELGAGFNMEYSGLENVYLNGTMIGFSRPEIDAKLDEILRFADIGEFIHQPVKTYSSGMFVRLAFAVAINIEPEILIVDEALSVGDVFFQAKCYRKFEEFKEQGKTILFVSHDLGSISKYCDRVILLNKGIKLAEGNPKEMVDLYKKVLVRQENVVDEGVSGTQESDSPQNQQEKSGENRDKWVKPFNDNPNKLEYGDRQAEILDYTIVDQNGVATNTIEKGTMFTILVKIRCNEPVEDPISAFSIKDIRGTEICGTNTMFEKNDIGRQEKGDIREISFTQKMDLQGGEYLLSLGCTGYQGGDFTVFHRLYDICNLSVVSTKNTVGFFDMNSVVEIK